MSEHGKPTLAVHKFSSCDGCQLALLNLGETLLELSQQVQIIHFAEAGPMAPDQYADIALVEGSISTPEDVERIRGIRKQTGYLISIGACATSGGLQALRNMADTTAWVKDIYARPEYISVLNQSTPISEHVPVELELWGCPANSGQVLNAVRDLLSGVKPRDVVQPLCLECKRLGIVCGLVTRGEPCMGPVTRAGCGALCTGSGRACYACYGPADQVNGPSMGNRLGELGLSSQDIEQRFAHINSHAPAFSKVNELKK